MFVKLITIACHPNLTHDKIIKKIKGMLNNIIITFYKYLKF